MGGKAPKEQTQRVEPPAFQQPFLESGLREAQRLYQAGPQQYFPRPTYVPFAQQTEQALGLQEQRALQGSPVTQAAQGLAAQTLGQRPDISQTQQQLQQIAGGQGANLTGLGGVGTGGVGGLEQAISRSLGQVTGLPQQAEQALSGFASGQQVGQNPYLQATFEQAARPLTQQFTEGIAPAVAAQFGLAGRTGSGAHQAAASRAAERQERQLTDLATGIYGGAYDRERQRQLQAAGQLGQLGQGQQQLGLQALGQGTQAFQQAQAQDISRRGLEAQNQLAQQQQRLQAAGQLGNIYGQQLAQQQGFANLAPTLAAQDYLDIDRLRGVGQQVEGLGQRALQDQINRFNFQQEAPQQALDRYLQRVSGINLGQTTTQAGASGSPLGGVLGGLASLAGLFF